MSEAEMEKLGFQIATSQAIKEKAALEQEINNRIEFDEELSPVRMNESQIESPFGDQTILQMEAIQEKQDEIERLQDMLEKEK